MALGPGPTCLPCTEVDGHRPGRGGRVARGLPRGREGGRRAEAGPLPRWTVTGGEAPQDGVMAPRTPHHSRPGEKSWRRRVPGPVRPLPRSPTAPRRFPQLSACHRSFLWFFFLSSPLVFLSVFFSPNVSHRQSGELCSGLCARQEGAVQCCGAILAASSGEGV